MSCTARQPRQLFLGWFGPIQMPMQKIESTFSVDAVAALEELDGGPIGKT
jgi:hypothetical protein